MHERRHPRRYHPLCGERDRHRRAEHDGSDTRGRVPSRHQPTCRAEHRSIYRCRSLRKGWSTCFARQAHAAYVIAKKDAVVCYLKPPVISFRAVFPLFFYLAFAAGRDLLPKVMVRLRAGCRAGAIGKVVGAVVTAALFRGPDPRRVGGAGYFTALIDIGALVVFSAEFPTLAGGIHALTRRRDRKRK